MLIFEFKIAKFYENRDTNADSYRAWVSFLICKSLLNGQFIVI